MGMGALAASETTVPGVGGVSVAGFLVYQHHDKSGFDTTTYSLLSRGPLVKLLVRGAA